jgi:MFS family permease
LLGLVAFANAAPVLVASPIAGAVLDRIDRRKVLLAVQLTLVVTGFTLATLVAAGVVQVWHIMAIAVINGIASGFDWPARLTLMPALVERRQLNSAVALTAAAFNGSRIIGPAIGGFLIGAVGLAVCFYFNAAMYVPFVLVLAGLSIDQAVVPADSVRGVRGAFGNLLDGYRYIWRTPTIRGLLSVDIVPLMFGLAYFTLAPAVARDVLGLGGRGLGFLLAANGIGSLAGTIGVAMLSGVRRRGRIVIAGVGCFGALLILYALSSNMILSLLLILALGLATSTYATFNDTLVQTLVDENYRGHVLAVYTMLWGLTPIGGLEAGFLARFIGVQGALVVNGLIVLVYVPILLRFTPVRRID